MLFDPIEWIHVGRRPPDRDLELERVLVEDKIEIMHRSLDQRLEEYARKAQLCVEAAAALQKAAVASHEWRLLRYELTQVERRDDPRKDEIQEQLRAHTATLGPEAVTHLQEEMDAVLKLEFTEIQEPPPRRPAAAAAPALKIKAKKAKSAKQAPAPGLNALFTRCILGETNVFVKIVDIENADYKIRTVTDAGVAGFRELFREAGLVSFGSNILLTVAKSKVAEYKRKITERLEAAAAARLEASERAEAAAAASERAEDLIKIKIEVAVSMGLVLVNGFHRLTAAQQAIMAGEMSKDTQIKVSIIDPTLPPVDFVAIADGQ